MTTDTPAREGAPAPVGPALAEPGFPIDDYTPHGYLDVTEHTRRLTPKGVVRSHDIGFRWHFPALGTGYGGRRETYRAGLRIGVDGAVALADFDEAVAPYHSKGIVRFRARRGEASLLAEFHLAGPDVIVARVSARCRSLLTIRVDYRRHIGADQGWGESGLVGRCVGDVLLLQGFEDGEAFALWTSRPADARGITAGAGTAGEWAAGGVPGGSGAPVTVLGERGDVVRLSGVAEFSGGGGHDMVVLLARGRSEREALRRLAAARDAHEPARAARLVEDQRFWAVAPRLTGDWPAHWRRGLVYDLETVRMMVRPPVGVYTRAWDAMQIQAPRVVLGEAAIDALLLGYADPAAAQGLLLGTFADALEPNVPCSREDGSVNMVAADGSNCGTGPQWGYPWLVAQWLYDARPDRGWLAELYPRLAAYLDWWLEHRSDADGWLAHACSWESGQDLSPRFGDQPLGGGHPVRHLRPVDLHASFAHAAGVMARFAGILGRDRDVPGWQRLADAYRDRTAALWTGERYADVDSRTGAATVVDDVMLLAPLALGLAEPERADRLRPAIRAIDADTVVWPMFAWTHVAAALAAGENGVAAAAAASVVDRAYRFWDARVHGQDRTLPGVACEYWPVSGRCGGEGYGWGAFGAHLLLGVLLGLRVGDDGLSVRPNLPQALRVPGRRYGVRLTCRGVPVTVEFFPTAGGVRVEVDGDRADLAWGEERTWPLPRS